MPTLAMHISGEYTVREIKRAVMAGNAQSDAIMLASEIALRHHFKIDRDAGGWFVEDLSNTELVTVNGIPILRRYLSNGDEICLDDDAIVFHNDEPEPTILLAEPNGVVPGAPNDIPATGPFMERVIINLAYSNKRKWWAWCWTSIISLALALAFLVYAVVEAKSFEQPPQKSNSAHAIIADAKKCADAGNYGKAIQTARLALRESLPPEIISALNADIGIWLNFKARQENASASKETDRAMLLIKHPGTLPAFAAITSLADEQAARLYSRYENVRYAWQKVQNEASGAAAHGAYLQASAMFESFVQNYPDSPFGGMAAVKAREYASKSRVATEDFYYRSRSPRLLSFDLHSPQAIINWRADTGEWIRSGRGLKLDSLDGPQGLILYEKHEYCGSSLWLRLCAARPRDGVLWAGLWHEDSDSLRIEISPSGGCIKMASSSGRVSKDFVLPKGDVIQIEMAIFEGSLVIISGENEMRMSGLEMAGQVSGWPALGASAAGAEFIGFEIGW